MPPSLSTLSRAAIPTLALLASGPSSALAQAPVIPTVTAPVVVPAAGGAPVISAPSRVPTSGRLARISGKHLTYRTGSTVSVRGRATTAPIRLELRVGSTGRKVADATANPGNRFKLEGSALPGEALRLIVHRADGPETTDVPVGTVRRLRPALASWYGPGLYGNRTACGQTLSTALKGVAHKSLPCGTQLTVRYGGRSTTATVVDRGPYAGAREFDLTSATAQAIGFRHVGRVWVSRG